MKYEQMNLFGEEKITLTEIKQFIAEEMTGYGNENCWEIKGIFVHKDYVIAGHLKSGSKERREACHYSFLIDINSKGMGKIASMDLEHSWLGSEYSTLQFIRKLERCRVLKKINIFVFCNKWQLLSYMKYFIDGKKCNFELLVWNKTNPVPLANGSYMHDKELCLNFWESGAKRVGVHDIKHGKTVYNIPSNQKDKNEYHHPTIKPMEMVRNFVEIGTDEGGVILDCFMGSGTTAIACKETKRHFVGFEKSEKWWNVANERLLGISQKDKEPIQGYVQERLI